MIEIPVVIERVLERLGSPLLEAKYGDCSVWTRNALLIENLSGESNLPALWEKNYRDISRCGGVFVLSYKHYPQDLKGQKTEVIAKVVYPISSQYLRGLFDECGFGIDGSYSFGEDGPIVDNRPEQIAKRREAAVGIFDRMSQESTVIISQISETSAQLESVDCPSVEWSEKWGNIAWDFFSKYYCSYEEIDRFHTFTRKECKRLAKLGTILLGGYG